jgi:hypothetical protein
MLLLIDTGELATDSPLLIKMLIPPKIVVQLFKRGLNSYFPHEIALILGVFGLGNC